MRQSLSRFTNYLLAACALSWSAYVQAETVQAPFTPASNVHSSAEEVANQNTTAWGKHGMLIFGGEQYLYASHLPMFHAPHHYQVIFRFHLQDCKREQELRQQLRKKAQVWTIDPIEFDLLSLSSSPTGWTFQADVFEGHFERDGIKRYSQQSIVVDEVLVFRELKMGISSEGAVVPGQKTALAKDASPWSAGHYYLLKDGSRFFAMKEIDRRPDFDTLLMLTTKSLRLADLPKMLSLPTKTLSAPSRAQWLEALKAYGTTSLLKIETIYHETEDLK